MWEKDMMMKGFTHLTGGRAGATRTYACGEGTGGTLLKGSVSYPLLKQKSPYGSSGWGDSPPTRSPVCKDGVVHYSPCLEKKNGAC